MSNKIMLDCKTTIIMATLNAVSFISDAIESALLQTHSNFKLLIVDGGSTDGTNEIIKSYLSDYRVKYLVCNIDGQAQALHYGLGFVDTEYVLQLDADDILAHDALEILESEMATLPQNTAMVYATGCIVTETKKYVKSLPVRPIRNKYDAIMHLGPMVPRMYRVSALRQVGGWICCDDPYNGRFAEDKLLLYRLIGHFGIYCIPKQLYTIRRHGRNQTDKFVNEHNLAKMYAIKNHLKKWGDEFSPIFSEVDGWTEIKLKPNKIKKVNFSRPIASIVVAARNRCHYLENTLASLSNQNISSNKFEVIIVNDGSNDRTAESITSTKYPFNLQIISLQDRNYCSGAKNEGVRTAKGDLIIFTDADYIVPPTFVEAHVEKHNAGSREYTVCGIVDWLHTLTIWDNRLASQHKADLCTHYPELKDLEATPNARNTQVVFPDDIIKFVYPSYRYIPSLMGGKLSIWKKWAKNPTTCLAPWLLFVGRNQSLLRATFERVGYFDISLKRMADWDFGYRLLKSGVTFDFADQAEGFHQVHPRDSDFSKNVLFSYNRLLERDKPSSLVCLGAYLGGLVDMEELSKMFYLYEQKYHDKQITSKLAEISRSAMSKSFLENYGQEIDAKSVLSEILIGIGLS